MNRGWSKSAILHFIGADIGRIEPNIIGQGLQFAVYDEGDRVRKKPNSNREILRLLARSNVQSVVNPLGLGREARRIARERDEAVQEFARREFDHTLVANATKRGKTIVQDKVSTFGEALKASENPEELLDKLVAFTREAWGQGLCETSFNFTVNHGIAADGNVVIIDIGELSFDKDVVARHIRERFWEKAWTFENDLTDEQREYAKAAFAEGFNLEDLDLLWTDAPVIEIPGHTPSAPTK